MTARGLAAALAALCLLGSAWAGRALAEPDATPPGSSIRFVGRNLIATADGHFHRWRYTRVEVDPARPAAGVVEVEVDVASLDTGIARRDDHLRSADFFDVERFPVARVRIRNARRDGETGDGQPRYAADFELTIRDVTRTLEGTFEVLSTSPARVRGELVLDRVDFGVGAAPSRWNPLAVRREVPVRFEAEVTLP